MAAIGRPRKKIGEKRVAYTFTVKPSTIQAVEALLSQKGYEDISLSQFVELLLLSAINTDRDLREVAPNLFTLSQEKPLKNPQKPLKKPSTIVVKRKGK
jgi:hypothetical protein